MTLQQIDGALAAWNGRLAAIAENLLELESQGSYKVLTGSGGLTKLKLRGVTAARVVPALAALPTVFEHFGLLHATVDQAAKLRADLPTIFGVEAKQRELEQLLFGRSVRLPEGPVPLQHRTLLSGAEGTQLLTMEELLAPMSAGFAAARDAVLLVGSAWEELAAGLDRAEAELRSLGCDPQGQAGGSARDTALDRLRERIGAIRARSQSDPLGALAELEKEIRPELAAVHRRTARTAELRLSLRSAHTRLEELLALHADATGAWAMARARVMGCDTAVEPVAEDRLEALRQWLERLAAHCDESTVEAVSLGLRRWHTMADTCAGQDSAAAEAHRSAYERVAELRGRLEALQAKARGYGIGDEEPIATMAREATALLRAQPVDLDLSAAAVAGYERGLRRIQAIRKRTRNVVSVEEARRP